MNRVIDVASLIVVVAGIMVLVRPGSQGPSLVTAIGNSFSSAISTATGSGVPRNLAPTGWAASK